MYKGVAMELLKVKKITSLEKVFPDQEPSGEGMEDVDRKSTRLNSSHKHRSRMPSSA